MEHRSIYGLLTCIAYLVFPFFGIICEEWEKRPVFAMRRKTLTVFVREALYLFFMA